MAEPLLVPPVLHPFSRKVQRRGRYPYPSPRPPVRLWRRGVGSSGRPELKSMGPGKEAPGARAAGPELPAPSASAVEERLLEAAGGFPLRLAGERLGIVTAPSPPALGRAVALRFLEWALAHPDGVCSLPTGRTPEHFITSTRRLLGGWATPAVQAELRAAGLRPGPARPDLRRLTFVQMDEYVPVDPSQRTSYASYIRRYYLEGFGLDSGKALLMDTWRPREVLGLLDGDADGPGYESLGDLFAEGVDEGLRFREPADARERAQAAALRGVDQCVHTGMLRPALPDETDPA